MNFSGNSVVYHTNLIDYLKVFPKPIWYDLKGFANILSMELAERHYPVTYRKYTCSILYNGGINKRHFVRSEWGLYSLGTSAPINNETSRIEK